MLKKYFFIAAIFYFHFSSYCQGNFNFSLYNASFNYPSGWTIQQQTSSSVLFNIGSSRIFYIEILPALQPMNYIRGQEQLYDTSYANFKVICQGEFIIANLYFPMKSRFVI